MQNQSSIPSKVTLFVEPKILLPILTYIVSNISLTLFTKYLFNNTHFKVPAFIIIIEQAIIGTVLLVYYSLNHFEQLKLIRFIWKPILIFSLLFALQILTGLEGLLHTSIALHQIIKSTTPCLTMVFAYFIEKKTYPKKLWNIALVIIAGTILTVYQNPSFTLTGFYFVILTVVISALMTSFNAKLFKTKINDVFLFSLFISFPTLIFCVPFFYFTEYNAFNHSFLHDFNEQRLFIGCYLLIACLLTFINKLSFFLIIKHTASEYSEMVSNFKITVLVFISIILFHDPLFFLNVLGIFVACIGFFYYSYVLGIINHTN